MGDINDNAPVFRQAYEPVVAADASRGSEVIRFYATDADLPENGPPFTFTSPCNRDACRDFTFEFVPGRHLGFHVPPFLSSFVFLKLVLLIATENDSLWDIQLLGPL